MSGAKDYTTYDAATGEIYGNFLATAEDAALNVTAGCRLVEGRYSWLDGYFRNNQFSPYSPTQKAAKSVSPPFPARWDNTFMRWVDTRDAAHAWIDVRRAREAKLVATDWTQLPDVPLATKAAWATYRQALRDVTQQPDPFNITWPVPPT